MWEWLEQEHSKIKTASSQFYELAEKVAVQGAPNQPPDDIEKMLGPDKETTTTTYSEVMPGPPKSVEEELAEPEGHVVDVLKIKDTEAPAKKDPKDLKGDAKESPIKAAMLGRVQSPFEKTAVRSSAIFQQERAARRLKGATKRLMQSKRGGTAMMGLPLGHGRVQSVPVSIQKHAAVSLEEARKLKQMIIAKGPRINRAIQQAIRQHEKRAGVGLGQVTGVGRLPRFALGTVPGALVGAGVGAGTGAIAAPEGQRARGAGIGALVGGLGGGTATGLALAAPSPRRLQAAGNLAGAMADDVAQQTAAQSRYGRIPLVSRPSATEKAVERNLDVLEMPPTVAENALVSAAPVAGTAGLIGAPVASYVGTRKSKGKKKTSAFQSTISKMASEGKLRTLEAWR